MRIADRAFVFVKNAASSGAEILVGLALEAL